LPPIQPCETYVNHWSHREILALYSRGCRGVWVSALGGAVVKVKALAPEISPILRESLQDRIRRNMARYDVTWLDKTILDEKRFLLYKNSGRLVNETRDET
jgi:hypothetical protein